MNGLRDRFLLLDTQYNSDLKRLSAIAETSRRLQQVSPEFCPVCGSAAECHDMNHQEVVVVPEEVARSCDAERKRIQSLQADLTRTQSDIEEESKNLSNEYAEKQEALNLCQKELSGGSACSTPG